MQNESAVDFPTPTRVHVALGVRALEPALRFYRALLGQEPTKQRSGYAKFEVVDPPLNLALNETPDAVAPPMPQHFGIQVKRQAAVGQLAQRMRDAGFAGQAEDQVTCCYAVQDKIWVTDPDGHRWELFIVTDADAPVHSIPQGGRPPGPDPSDREASADADPEPCCAPTCCK